MLIQRQPQPLQHMDGQPPAWLGHGHWGPGRRGPGESPAHPEEGWSQPVRFWESGSPWAQTQEAETKREVMLVLSWSS